MLFRSDDNGQPIVAHVDLWNQQTVYASEEQPFYTPAIFIEFPDIQWQTLPHGVREATVDVSLHVVTDSREGHWEDAADTLDLSDSINTALHGLTWQDNQGSAINPLTSVLSSTDSDFDELMDNIEVFRTHIVDASAKRKGKTAVASPSISVRLDVPSAEE